MGRKKVSTIFSLLCLLLTVILLISNISFDDVFTHVIKTNFCFPRAVSNSDEFHSANGSRPGCLIPHVDPFDPSILAYLINKTLECPISPQLTAITNPDDWLIVQIPDYFAEENIRCFYSWLYRDGSDERVSYGRVSPIPKIGVKFKSNVVAVNTSCIDVSNHKIIYRNVHFRIPKFDVPPTSSLVDTKPSVLILVIESLGRLSFQRFMSSTSKALDKIGNFHHLTALNRVEENSFPNSMALLTGMAVTDNAASAVSGVHWDHGLPFSWDLFKNNGYVTAFLEDQPMAGLFSYYNKGFRLPPTDYYPVEFWSHMYPDGTEHMIKLLVDPENYCYEKVGPKVEIYLQMCSKFTESVLNQRNPYFLYAFYSQMTHEDFNNFQFVDKPVAQFLSSLSTQLLDNSIILIMGDHGSRIGQISPISGDPTNSPMGRLEGSLPFAAIRIPDSLDRKYPHLRQYLTLNQNRLSTWFDIHQILLDVAQGNFDPILRRKEIPVAYSSFREEVPYSRTCEDAHISPIYCACNGRVGINPNSKTHHIDAAKGLVDNLRTIFQKNKCRSKISYGKTFAGEYFYPRSNETWSTFERVKLTIDVIPSHAVITGTVYRWRNTTDYRWSSWTFYDPAEKLKSPVYSKNLTKLLCVSHLLKNINITIV